MIKSFHSFQSYTQLHSFYFHQLGVSSVQIFSSHYLILFLLSSLGETSCWSKVSWEPDQFIYSPHISSYTFCYLHWEKQVVDQSFMSLISSYILLTLSHTLLTIFIGRNKLLIKSFMSLISSYIPSHTSSCILFWLSSVGETTYNSIIYMYNVQL